MGVDWGLAGQIGGFGFSLVFAVLVILAVAIWLGGALLRKIGGGKAEAGDNKKKGV